MKENAELPHPRPFNSEHYGLAIVPDVIAKLAATWDPATNHQITSSFGIHLANTHAGRHSASMLINKMYRWRGYGDQQLIEEHPHHITLTASEPRQLLGTVTLQTDSDNGMLADQTFKDEIDVYRRTGAKVCEITKLAIDPLAHPKLAQASLFHIIYLYARKIYLCTDVFIEVNPRHKRFYEQMLGFEVASEVRNNGRVNAPARLLRISLDHMGVQIRKMGGTGATIHRDTRRSLYPYFFGSNAEASIMSILTSLTGMPQVGPY